MAEARTSIPHKINRPRNLLYHRQDFLKTLAEACQEAGWQIRPYCLIGELGISKSANARLHQLMAPLSPSDPRQGQLRI